MDLGVPLHPLAVHGPIVLIVMGALFELTGRALDLEWWRKAAFAMLVGLAAHRGGVLVYQHGAGVRPVASSPASHDRLAPGDSIRADDD